MESIAPLKFEPMFEPESLSLRAGLLDQWGPRFSSVGDEVKQLIGRFAPVKDLCLYWPGTDQDHRIYNSCTAVCQEVLLPGPQSTITIHTHAGGYIPWHSSASFVIGFAIERKLPEFITVPIVSELLRIRALQIVRHVRSCMGLDHDTSLRTSTIGRTFTYIDPLRRQWEENVESQTQKARAEETRQLMELVRRELGETADLVKIVSPYERLPKIHCKACGG
jgi:hypothetical protein